METILASLISGAVAIIVCIINSNVQHKKVIAEIEKQTALQEYRLKQIEAKQDKHNQLIERTYELEKDVAILKEEVHNHETK